MLTVAVHIVHVRFLPENKDWEANLDYDALRSSLILTRLSEEHDCSTVMGLLVRSEDDEASWTDKDWKQFWRWSLECPRFTVMLLVSDLSGRFWQLKPSSLASVVADVVAEGLLTSQVKDEMIPPFDAWNDHVVHLASPSMFARLFLYIYLYTHTLIYRKMCFNIGCMQASTYVYIYTFIIYIQRMCIYVYIYIQCVYVYMCTYKYKYIYIYV